MKELLEYKNVTKRARCMLTDHDSFVSTDSRKTFAKNYLYMLARDVLLKV